MLAIRGISDMVGLKRSDAWTKYACASAAAFTRAFLRTRPIELMAAAGSATNSPRVASKPDQTHANREPHLASQKTGETRVTADDLFNLLSKLLPSQVETVLFRARVPIEHLPSATAPQADRAIATIRHFELQGRLDQLARTVQQVMTGGGQVDTDPR